MKDLPMRFYSSWCRLWKLLPALVTLTKEIDVQGKPYILLYFSHAMICFQHTNPKKTKIETSLHHRCQGRSIPTNSLQWRHNGRDGTTVVDGLLNRLFKRRSNQRKHQSCASLAFVKGNHRWPMDRPPPLQKKKKKKKGPETREMLPFDNFMMYCDITLGISTS